jgi:multidrug efflux pump subunit AcrA (membrane-fusion protein)
MNRRQEKRGLSEMNRTLFLALGASFALALAGCAAKASTPQHPEIPIYIQAAVSPAAVPLYVGPGSVAPSHTYHLGFEIPGRIATVSADVGDRVRADDVLAQLDASDYEAQTQAAEARAAAAQAQAAKAANGARPQERDAARESVEAAQAELDRALAAARLAHANFLRYDALFHDGAISALQHDAAAVADQDAQDHVASARAGLASAKSGASLVLEGARGEDRAAADAVAAAAVADAELARVTLAKAGLRSPAEAYVESRSIEPGDEASPGVIAFVLVSATAPEVRASVPERLLTVIDRGTLAVVDLAGERYRGVITRIEPAADAETRTAMVRISVPGLRVKPGAVVTVALGERRLKGGVSVPLSAVLTDAIGGTSVLIYDAANRSVTARPVRIASIEADRALVEGLRVGDPVVTSGQHEAHTGDRVLVINSRRAP